MIKMKIPFCISVGTVPYKIEPMLTADEKSIIEFDAMIDPPDYNLVFENICELLQVPDLPLSYQYAYIYKIREISFGSDLELQFICENCKHPIQNTVLIQDLLIYKKTHFTYNLHENVTTKQILEAKISNLSDIIDTANIDNNNIMDALQDVKSRLPTVRPTVGCRCPMCGHVHEIQILNKKFCIESLSTHTITSIYQAYNYLVKYGFTKLDVDSMLPFEREVHLSLIERQVKEVKDNTKL